MIQQRGRRSQNREPITAGSWRCSMIPPPWFRSGSDGECSRGGERSDPTNLLSIVEGHCGEGRQEGAVEVESRDLDVG